VGLSLSLITLGKQLHVLYNYKVWFLADVMPLAADELCFTQQAAVAAVLQQWQKNYLNMDQYSSHLKQVPSL